VKRLGARPDRSSPRRTPSEGRPHLHTRRTRWGDPRRVSRACPTRFPSVCPTRARRAYNDSRIRRSPGAFARPTATATSSKSRRCASSRHSRGWRWTRALALPDTARE